MTDERREGVVLYGSYASYYTAKTRSYLRKKGIAFIERPPSHPRFRSVIRPGAESRRIPIIEDADGRIVQDTTEIVDHLERLYPDPPAFPPGPAQRLAAYLLDLFFSENSKVAWHYRWNFMEDNAHFVRTEFGRSFTPRGSDEEVDRYGGIIADRMSGYGAAFGITPDLFPVLETLYVEWLDTLEQHFRELPYLFGGTPSIADFALMGPMFAHLGRDPHPLHLMQTRAPRVFRWIEHMNTPEIVTPEFWDQAPTYLDHDEIPPAVMTMLRRYCADWSGLYAASAGLFAQWVADHAQTPSGAIISDADHDQPFLGPVEMRLRGRPIRLNAPLHPLWMLQRILDWREGLSPEDRAKADHLADQCGAGDLLSLRPARRLTRVRNRLAVV
jgi:glutathione S-transferase